MEPSAHFVNRLNQAEIESAKRQSFAQKFMAGAELFDYACSITLSGIRMQHPNFNEAQVKAELHRRLAIGRHLEEPQ